jgi:hypothetical protein
MISIQEHGVTMREADVVFALLEFGAHQEGCPRALAALQDCTCGWSQARLNGLRLAGQLGARSDDRRENDRHPPRIL